MMKNLFFMGGSVFMSILTLLLTVVIAWLVYQILAYAKSNQPNKSQCLRMLKYGKSIGLLALIIGIFAQLTGFYQAFSAIENAVDVSPAMVFGGIKASMVTTLYGMGIYLISILMWFVASLMIERKQ